MAPESPMMRRMHRDTGTSPLRIPRRGRIRLALAILALIAGFRLAGAIFTRGGDADPPQAEPVVRTSEAPAKSERRARPRRQSLRKAALNRKHGFGIEQLRELLKEQDCSFTAPSDTLGFGPRAAVLHFAIDTALQNFGYRLMQRYRPLYGAAVVMAPHSGRVLAMVSWKGDSVADLGNDLYCKSIFPAASVFKTVTAAAAIEVARLNAQSPLRHVGRNHTLYRFQLQRELRDFREMPFEEAYAHSVNTVFARVGMYMLGKGALRDYSLKFGFNTEIPFELDNETPRMMDPDSEFTIAELASGFNQHTTISPLFGAMMAASIAERGRMPRPVLVDSVVVDDSCVYRAVPSTWRTPVREATASELRLMMSKVSRYGTARKSFRYMRQTARYDSLQYGGKTGSVDKDSLGRVDWFVGFVRHPADQRRRLAVGIVTVHGAYWTVHSSFLAAEIFRVHLRAIELDDQRREKAKALAECETSPPGKS